MNDTEELPEVVCHLIRLISLFCAWYQLLCHPGLKHQGTTLLQKNFNNGNCCDNNDDNTDKREHANKRTEFKDSSAALQFPVSIKVCKAFI